MGSWERRRIESLSADALNDVLLVGTDGKEKPCSKTLLASVSPVFMRMFFGDFHERSSGRCPLDFHSEVIELIVKYCYCGKLDLDLISSMIFLLEDEAYLFVEVREAARFFELEDLFSDVESRIGNLVFYQKNGKNYQYASAFLTEFFKRGEAEEPLGLALHRFAVEHAMECFGPKALENGNYHHSHPTVLSNVLEETKDTYTVVRCLQVWYSVDRNSVETDYSDEEKQALIEVAQNIDLMSLSKTELLNVKPCSLFSADRILEALVHQCRYPDKTGSKIPRASRLWLYTTGESIGDLDGYYKQMYRSSDGLRSMLNVFMKQVQRNGRPCRLIAHRRHKENKWLISITKNDEILVSTDHGEVLESCIQTDFYESSYQPLPTDDPAVPPFNTWKTLEGDGPAPIVASIYRNV